MLRPCQVEGSRALFSFTRALPAVIPFDDTHGVRRLNWHALSSNVHVFCTALEHLSEERVCNILHNDIWRAEIHIYPAKAKGVPYGGGIDTVKPACYLITRSCVQDRRFVNEADIDLNTVFEVFVVT